MPHLGRVYASPILSATPTLNSTRGTTTRGSTSRKSVHSRRRHGVLDPSAFAEDGGPSISERLSRGSANKIHFRRADNTRVPRHGAMGGWDQLRARLVGDGEGRPMIVTFSTCVDSIRTIPFLQHD